MKTRHILQVGKILSDKTNLNSSMSWSNRLRGKKTINFCESTLSIENEDSQIKENTQTNEESDSKKIPIYLRDNKLTIAKENTSPQRSSNIYQFEIDANEPVNKKKVKGTKRKKINKEDEELEKIEKKFKCNQNNILKEIKKHNIKSKIQKTKIKTQENINKTIILHSKIEQPLLPIKNSNPEAPNKKIVLQSKNQQSLVPLKESNPETPNKKIVLQSKNQQSLVPLKESNQDVLNKIKIQLKTKMAQPQETLKEFNGDNSNCMNISLPLATDEQNIERTVISSKERQSMKSIENTPNSLDKSNMSTSQRPTFIAPSPIHSSFSSSCNQLPATPYHVTETPNFADLTPIKNFQVAFHSTPIHYTATSPKFHLAEYSRIPQISKPNQHPINRSLQNTSSIHNNRSLNRLMDSRESSLKRSYTVINTKDSKFFGFDSENISEESPEKNDFPKKEDLKDLKKKLTTKLAPLIKPIPKENDENNYDNNCDYEQSFLASPRINDKSSKLKQKKINQMDFNSHYSSYSSSFSYQNQTQSFNVNDSPHIFEEDPPHSHTKPPRKSYQREKKQVKFVGGEIMSAEEIDFEEVDDENKLTNEESMELFEEIKKKTKKKSKQDKINDKLIKEIKKEFSEVDDYELVIE